MPRHAGTVALKYTKARAIRRLEATRGKECQFCEFWGPLPKGQNATALVRHGRCDLVESITEQGDGCENWQDDGIG